MLITIEELRKRVRGDCDRLVADLQSLTGRFGSEEAQAWRRSLSKLSDVFQAPSFQHLHLYFGSRGNVALEYQLPASPSWCDVVLLGAHQDRPSAVIVELKDWMTRSDRPGSYEGLIDRRGFQELHPCEQVRGYAEYCREFHSTVVDRGAAVYGCVLFTSDHWAAGYADPPNEELTRKYPFFTTAPQDIATNLPAYFATRLSSADSDFAVEFTRGKYRQQRGFVAQIGAQILDPTATAFELLDGQRRAFALCRGAVDGAFLGHGAGDAPPKMVVIIVGPPGSGKSVIAARLWAALVTDRRLPDGDVVLTTTSQSQHSNWAELFRRTSGLRSAAGCVRKATSYSPITTHRLGQLRGRYGEEFLDDAGDWRGNLEALVDLGEEWRDGAQTNQNLVTIVDEAHALINTEHPSGRGQFGFAPTLGPQAYHIIRSSLLTVFLLDPLQGFRARENTTIEDIKNWARELGADEPLEITLDDVQFRCAGSPEFVRWVEQLLGGVSEGENRQLAATWHEPRPDGTAAIDGAALMTEMNQPLVNTRSATPSDVPTEGRLKMDFRVFEEPQAWEHLLRERAQRGHSVRLLSTFSRKWKTAGMASPHRVKPSMMDFHEEFSAGGQRRFWSRVWNYLPQQGNYTWFVAGAPGGLIADDPLCEVGCPYVVRGFDFDYVGALWLNDLAWRGGRWRVDPSAVRETGVSDLVKRAQRAGESSSEYQELVQSVIQAYRIVLTRALRGLYVWIPDAETRDHVLRSLA